jgi:hypothetical protein
MTDVGLAILDDDSELDLLVLAASSGDEHAWREVCQDVELALGKLLRDPRVTGRAPLRDAERKHVIAEVLARLREDGFRRLALYVEQRRTHSTPRFSTWLRVLAQRAMREQPRAMPAASAAMHQVLHRAAELLDEPQLSALELWTQSASFGEIAGELGFGSPDVARGQVEAALDALRDDFRARAAR